MNQWKIRFTPAAKEDLKQIGGYIAHNLQNPIAAKGFLSRIQKEIQKLSYLPERFERVYEEQFPEIELRRMVVGSYLVFYHSDSQSQTVYIYRVVYGRQDLSHIPLNYED